MSHTVQQKIETVHSFSKAKLALPPSPHQKKNGRKVTKRTDGSFQSPQREHVTDWISALIGGSIFRIRRSRSTHVIRNSYSNKKTRGEKDPLNYLFIFEGGGVYNKIAYRCKIRESGRARPGHC
jgi:hypothetical protein